VTDKEKLTLIHGIVDVIVHPYDQQPDALAEQVMMVQYITSYLGGVGTAERRAAWLSLPAYCRRVLNEAAAS